MELSLLQIMLLAVVQGAAELLPVSSSAHVIVAEKFMGLDPSLPAMTFLLVMLHTGTMFAVIFYFWKRWKNIDLGFLKMAILATAVTGVIGLTLKKLIEKIVLERWLGYPQGEVEHLFKSLPLISFSLFTVGLLIILADRRAQRKGTLGESLTPRASLWIGLIQGLCLPFRGFSRSGATISTGLMMGVSRDLSESFSFALAVILTPAVVAHEFHRLIKSAGLVTGQAVTHSMSQFVPLVMPGLVGMCFSFVAGLGALYWLSSWLENGKWKFFGYYCLVASMVVLTVNQLGF